MTISLATKGVIQHVLNNFIVGANLSAALLTCSSPSTCSLCDERFQIIKGNALTLNILITLNGVRVDKATLESADNIIFVLKKSKLQANNQAAIYKDDIDGITILDDTDDASIQIVMDSDDTNIAPGAYFTALKVVFTSDNQQEAILSTEDCTFEITNVSLNIIS